LVVAIWNAGTAPAVALILAFGSLIGPAVVLATSFYCPLRYKVRPTEVVVVRFGPNVRIPLSKVQTIGVVPEKEVFGGSRRIAASGGLFGYFGHFSSRAFPSFRAYVSRQESLVLLQVQDGEPIVVSPDNPGAFVDAVRRARDVVNQRQPSKEEGNQSGLP
jgi:hypothetical protein